ncbi:DUF4244 domain-containing protein [Bifidobacterium psychraerophilum]|uniref:DUF4244 domain-containing protein n=1 Tax=Bifidobacterium psychraerophilum TaxID=218140 RepID=UPI0023F2F61C|nr:DUF4244 domain-containing protein [Bifidobacterium psychraerophilum]MCI1660634.1 DUF4244 domain-containing protein [Bifidobacterium psychraerophilum]MCI1803835.1 DUF4244 domain-containing protein [Bifidobacterium psychraerophilum]MCI2176157.1 DUF4244 domain-containing protein [Bifidobacterium psychraerophilum]MCI2181370.1 DUF4244 domain-containing protein [Bifidobacterium psychraerophilum]
MRHQHRWRNSWQLIRGSLRLRQSCDADKAGTYRSWLRRRMQGLSRQYYVFDARWRMLAAEPEAGMATAEYAVVLIAATGFAGLLVAILKSGEVRELLVTIIRQALNIG